ncbi:hypothetical protein CTAYLR_001248 [Chrysophaeum taylorii]|uniref:Uncharacterized protein n=1 Tax=Chrysophaeum taylorii TaxID=2483200 RepID=A0AAD7XL76_9STRA|nr:hypothetical protein CTAYLR_001248 [Chrysophaeum taylorii]
MIGPPTMPSHDEDEAAIKAEAQAIVARALKDLDERRRGQRAAKEVGLTGGVAGRMSQATSREDIQALIDQRLKQSMQGRAVLFSINPVTSSSQPLQPSTWTSRAEPQHREARADEKAEAAAIVAAAQKSLEDRRQAQKQAKTASPEELQAMINSRLVARQGQ